MKAPLRTFVYSSIRARKMSGQINQSSYSKYTFRTGKLSLSASRGVVLCSTTPQTSTLVSGERFFFKASYIFSVLIRHVLHIHHKKESPNDFVVTQTTRPSPNTQTEGSANGSPSFHRAHNARVQKPRHQQGIMSTRSERPKVRKSISVSYEV